MTSGEQQLALFPLDLVLVPSLVLPLHIFEPRYRQLLADAQSANPLQPQFGIVAADPYDFDGDGIHRVGTVARISEVERLDDGRSNITVVGQRRFRVIEVSRERPYLMAHVEYIGEDGEKEVSVGTATDDDIVESAQDLQLAALALRCVSLFQRWRAMISDVDEFEDALAGADEDPHLLSYILTAAVILPTRTRQQLLEATDTRQRLMMMGTLLEREVRAASALPSLAWSADSVRQSPN
jgi:Lon protease-like protein